MLDQHAECFYVPSLPRCSLCVGTGFLGGHLCIAEFLCAFPKNLKWLSQAGMGHVVSACLSKVVSQAYSRAEQSTIDR